jgi:hypothetical protein
LESDAVITQEELTPEPEQLEEAEEVIAEKMEEAGQES